MSKLISALLLLTATLGAKEVFVTALREQVGVYGSTTRKLSEKPLYSVGTQDRLRVIEEAAGHYRVENGEGVEGWVERSHCVRLLNGTQFSFQPGEVLGRLDDRPTILVLGGGGIEDMPIMLDRSFGDELRVNVDKETIARTVGGAVSAAF